MHTLLLLSLSAGLLLVSLFIVVYRRFPMHLIYRSKIGLQDMFDGISDPLAVIDGDFTVRRANRAYTSLVNKSFAEIIGTPCYELLRGRTSPCRDCLLKKSIRDQQPLSLARTEHPDGGGVLSISFSPFSLTLDNNEIGITEHIRDITLLEKLKHDLEEKTGRLPTP